MTRRKYNNNPAKWKPFKSGVEWEVDRCLKNFAGKGRKKIKHEYETEKLKYVIIKNYIPDFKITLPNGKVFYIECKGYFDRPAREKMVGVKIANPTLDIRFFFSQDNKLQKSSRKRYSDWCEEHGFPYAVGNLPKEWFV